jgi:hypothetical protein
MCVYLDGFQFHKPFATRLRPAKVLFVQNDVPGNMYVYIFVYLPLPLYPSISPIPPPPSIPPLYPRPPPRHFATLFVVGVPQGFLFSDKMTLLDLLDMYFVVLVIFNKYLIIFGQTLVTGQ